MPLALEYIEGQALAPTGWSSGEWALVNAQIRERSFFMAGVNQAHVLQRFRNVAAAVAGGTMGADEARIVLREYLAESGYRPEEGKEGTLQDLSSSARLNLVIDTNVRQARGWAQHVQYQRDPNVGGQELFRRFARAVPRNWLARWEQAAEAVGWEGVARGVPFVALLDSPVWRALSRFDLPYPPFDFNSGMATRPVSVERCRELGLTPHADTPPPSLNEETSASTAGLDADLVRSMEEVMGGLVRREGNRLQMADVNGTRPYTAPQLAAVLAAPLPKGVPRLQLEALTAWRENPQALLPGGEKHHLLPALRMLADRLRPEAPKKLQEFLRRVDEGAAGVVTNSRGDCRAEDPAHCRYHHPKGTTREGETKRRPSPEKEKKEKENVEVRTTYRYRREARAILDRQAKERQGATAPGMDIKFHITKESASELTSGAHAKQSDSYAAHYTAAVNALKLWSNSAPFEPPHDKERDRYNDYKDSPIEWVYYRKAIMTLNGEDYAVKITAKEYKGTSKLPIIYQVKAKKMRGLHARGASLGKTSSTAQIPYSFFESQSQP